MKVLLALDGSAPSLVARDLVAGLQWPGRTVVHLVSGYRVPVDWTGGVGSTMDWVGDVEDAIRDELTTTLTAAAKPLYDRGLAPTPAYPRSSTRAICATTCFTAIPDGPSTPEICDRPLHSTLPPGSTGQDAPLPSGRRFRARSVCASS